MAKSRNRKSKGRSRKPRAKSRPRAETPAPQSATSGPASAAPRAEASKPRTRIKPRTNDHPTSSPLALVVLALCVIGALLTAYLTYVAIAGDHPAYCSDGSSCDLVQSSRWSTFLGLPMAAWGLGTYLLLAYFCWAARRKPSRWKPAFLIAVCGFAISSYLTIISLTVIEATCGYCLASYALMTAILAGLAATKPPSPIIPAWGQTAPYPLITAVAVVVVLQFHFSGFFDPAAGPEDPRLRDLAMHLDETGAKFYGASWCPRCQEQKDLFEASVDRLPYVECSPSGRSGPPSAACTIKAIQDYPTWIIDGRRYVGVQDIAALEKYSRFNPDS